MLKQFIDVQSQAKRNKSKVTGNEQKQSGAPTVLFNHRYNICNHGACVMLSTSFKQHAAPNGRLHNRLCVLCNTPIVSESFSRLPVQYCRAVRNISEYDGEGEDALPHCENVLCADCSLPTGKRVRKQITHTGFNYN